MSTIGLLPALDEVDFGGLVRTLRQMRGLTQEQFARELEVTFGTVNGWENGKHEPIRSLRRRLVQIAEAAGLTSLPLKVNEKAENVEPLRLGHRKRRRLSGSGKRRSSP